jgi:hypothetical protein
VRDESVETDCCLAVGCPVHGSGDRARETSRRSVASEAFAFIVPPGPSSEIETS